MAFSLLVFPVQLVRKVPAFRFSVHPFKWRHKVIVFDDFMRMKCRKILQYFLRPFSLNAGTRISGSLTLILEAGNLGISITSDWNVVSYHYLVTFLSMFRPL